MLYVIYVYVLYVYILFHYVIYIYMYIYFTKTPNIENRAIISLI